MSLSPPEPSTRFDLERLYNLLPAIYRIHDAEQGDGSTGGPLRALLAVIAPEVGVVEDDLAQLYDDHFIETCAEWVVPYIGDLLAVRRMRPIRSGAFSQRAFVARTLGYRRRKGTLVMLEQLARDVTGWPAHAVEFFELLVTNQSLHHLRLTSGTTVDLRRQLPLDRLGSAFEMVSHGVDVRRIGSGHGRYNVPNIGVFLWRLNAYPLTGSPAVALDTQRYLFSPLGNNMLLFSAPPTTTEFSQIAQQGDVPEPLSRRGVAAALDRGVYGTGRSVFVSIGGVGVLAQHLQVCDLRDMHDSQGHVVGWAHVPTSGQPIAVDPALGRLALPPDAPSGEVTVDFHYGFSADMGGGEYPRTFDSQLLGFPVERVPLPHASIQQAWDTLHSASSGGVVEVDASGASGRHTEALYLSASAGQRLELRAADGSRPILVTGKTLVVDAADGADVTLDGLLIAGGGLHVVGQPQRLRLSHCTLVPGLALDVDGLPVQPGVPSLIVDTPPDHPVTIEIDHCIVGPLRLPARGPHLTILDSIVDARGGVAVAASDDGVLPGPPSVFERSTIIGSVHVDQIELASDAIFTAPAAAERRQVGCMRFSFVPDGSRTPRRYRCQPEVAVQQAIDLARGQTSPPSTLSPAAELRITLAARARVQPSFTQVDYGQPAYCQLDLSCATDIRAGASDGAEMGAFHDLFQPQREANLRDRFDEFLRFGLEAGLIYAS